MGAVCCAAARPRKVARGVALLEPDQSGLEVFGLDGRVAQVSRGVLESMQSGDGAVKVEEVCQYLLQQLTENTIHQN